MEKGEAEAHIHCPDENHFKMEFKTTLGVVAALLDLNEIPKEEKEL